MIISDDFAFGSDLKSTLDKKKKRKMNIEDD